MAKQQCTRSARDLAFISIFFLLIVISICIDDYQLRILNTSIHCYIESKRPIKMHPDMKHNVCVDVEIKINMLNTHLHVSASRCILQFLTIFSKMQDFVHNISCKITVCDRTKERGQLYQTATSTLLCKTQLASEKYISMFIVFRFAVHCNYI